MKKIIIEPGTKFGYLTVLREASIEERPERFRGAWFCLCDCGNKIAVTTQNLKRRANISCGCKNKNQKITINPREKYNNLTVIAFAPKEAWISNKPTWLCKCDCGKEKYVQQECLARNKVKSCGCLRNRKGIDNPNYTTGGNNNPTYRRWRAMINRCYSPSQKQNVYQTLGITVCPEWLDDFNTFLKDMGECPSDKHSLDRINNNLGYFPENCRWATPKEQARNRRDNIKIDGVPAAELAEKHGISLTLLHQRLNQGKTGEDLFKKPIKHNRSYDNNRGPRKLTNEKVRVIRERIKNGETKLSICKDYGVSRNTIAKIAKNKTYRDVT